MERTPLDEKRQRSASRFKRVEGETAPTTSMRPSTKAPLLAPLARRRTQLIEKGVTRPRRKIAPRRCRRGRPSWLECQRVETSCARRSRAAARCRSRSTSVARSRREPPGRRPRLRRRAPRTLAVRGARCRRPSSLSSLRHGIQSSTVLVGKRWPLLHAAPFVRRHSTAIGALAGKDPRARLEHGPCRWPVRPTPVRALAQESVR